MTADPSSMPSMKSETNWLATRALCRSRMRALLLRKPVPGRGPVAWFFRKFNAFFDWIIDRYGRIVGGLTRKATFSMLILVIVCGGIWGLGKVVPGGFIPDEDKGYLFVAEAAEALPFGDAPPTLRD